MLSNDLSKKLMIRFKKSKDFNKTSEKLRKDGYKVLKNYSSIYDREQGTKHVSILRVMKDNNLLLSIYYEENNDTTSEYKQLIHYITY